MSRSSDAKKTVRALGEHVKGLVGHTLDMATYNAHGHAAGRQGARGHQMPPNDAHKQGGSFIPQAVFNTFSQNGSAQADPAGSDDYGVVDEKA
jgi:hypothetical protein